MAWCARASAPLSLCAMKPSCCEVGPVDQGVIDLSTSDRVDHLVVGAKISLAGSKVRSRDTNRLSVNSQRVGTKCCSKPLSDGNNNPQLR